MLGVAASLVLLGFGGQWAVAALAFVSMVPLSTLARSVWTLVSQESASPEWRSMTAGISNLASGLGVTAAAAAGGYMVTRLGVPQPVRDRRRAGGAGRPGLLAVLSPAARAASRLIQQRSIESGLAFQE